MAGPTLSQIEAARARGQLQWADREVEMRRRAADPEVRRTRAEQILGQLLEKGEDIPEADWGRFIENYVKTGEVNYAQSQDFSGVQGRARPFVEPEPSLWENIVNTGKGILATHTAGTASGDLAEAVLEMKTLEAEGFRSLITPSEMRMASEYGRPLPSEDVLRERAAARRQELAEQVVPQLARRRNETAQEAGHIERLLGKGSTYDLIAKGVGGFTANAVEQSLPMAASAATFAVTRNPAAATGASAIASVPLFNSAKEAAYLEAVERFGAGHEEALDYANVIAALEFAPSVAFGALSGMWTQSAKRLGITSLTKDAVRQALVSRVRNPVARIGGAAVLEGGDEVIAGEMQDFAESYMHDNDFFSSLEANAELGKKVAENRENANDNRLERFVGGAIGSTIVGTPASVVGYRAEARREAGRRSALEDTIVVGTQAERAANEGRAAAARAEAERQQEAEGARSAEKAREAARPATQEDMFGSTESATTFEEQEAARQEQLRREAEENIAYRQRDAQYEQERSDATYERAEELLDYSHMRVDRARQRVEQVQEQLEIDPDSDNQFRSAASQENLAEAVDAMRDLRRAEESHASLEERLRARRPEPVVEDTVTVEPQPEPVQEALPLSGGQTAEEAFNGRVAELGPVVENYRKKQQAAAEGHITRARNDALRRIAAENPNLSTAEVVRLYESQVASTSSQASPNTDSGPSVAPTSPQSPAQPTGTPTPRRTPTEPSNTPPDPAVSPDDAARERELEDISSKLGLNMAAEAQANGTTPSTDRDTDRALARKLVEGLASRTRRDSIAVQHLLNQGKLIVAPSAESIGRSDKGVASYDPNTGKMYLYGDKLDLSDPTAAIMVAVHESVHGGQFNPREARSTLYDTLLGEGGVSRAAGKLRVSARNGNAIAREALAQAEADTAARGGDSTYENHELVAYFAGDAVMRRGSALGSAGGVVRDLITDARSVLRDRLGVDLDITLGDLTTAAARAAEEAVLTNFVPANGSATDALQMIYSGTATSFPQAEESGWTYDSVDGMRKFVLSDAESSINPEGVAKLMREGVATLSEVMNNPVLYREIPGAADVEVFAPPGDLVVRSANAAYHPASETISVRRDIANGDPDTFRGILLHEAQHYVQHMGGYADEFYDASRESPEYSSALKNQAEATARLDDAAEKFITAAPQLVDGPLADRVQEYATDFNVRSDVRAANVRDALRAAGADQSNPAVAEAINQYEEARLSYRKTADAYRAAVEKEHAKYLRNITEREAHRTQYDRDLPESVIRARGNPEPEMREQDADPETGFDPTEGVIDVPVGGTSDVVMPMSRDSTLSMAAPSPNTTTTETKRHRYVPAAITGLFRNDFGLGPDFMRLIEDAQGDSAAQRMVAENSYGIYMQGVDDLAQERGVDSRTIIKEINDKLDAIDGGTDGYAANKAAYAAVASQYGQAGEALMRLREQVDDLTMSILRQRAASGAILTDAEKKRYTTLLNNMGRYTHRMYASGSASGRKQFSKRVWDSYMKSKKGKPLTDTEKANVELVKRATKKLIDENLLIPDDEGLAKLSDERLSHLYSKWGSSPTRIMTREAMIDGLASVRDEVNGDSNRMNNAAEEIAKDLLGLVKDNKSTPIASFYHGLTQDNAILKKREKIPLDIRALMGEVDSPGAKLLATVGKSAEFVARNKMLLAMRDLVGPDLQPPGSTGKDIVVNNNMQPLQGEIYGPLEGWYASPNLQALLGGQLEMFATFDQTVLATSVRPEKLAPAILIKLYEKYAKVAGFEKFMKIVWNPVNFGFNFIGTARALAANAVTSPSSMKWGMDAARELIVYAANPSKGGEKAKLGVRYGVVDSAYIGEIGSMEYRQFEDQFALMAGGKPPSERLGKTKTAGRALKEIYAMADVWAKLASFHYEAEYLKKYYKAAGIDKSDHQIYLEAAERANRTNISYKRAMPLVKGLERGGLTQFGTYFYEVYRTEVMNLDQVVRDLKMSEDAPNAEAASIARWRAAQRFAGHTAALGLTATMTEMLNGMVFGDDEEEAYAKRGLLGEFLQDQDIVPVGVDKNGNIVLFGVSRVDPAGPMTDILRQMIVGKGSAAEVGQSIMDMYIAPRLTSQLITLGATALGAETRMNYREPNIDQLSRKAYESGILPVDAYDRGIEVLPAGGYADRVVRALFNVADNFAPGIVNSWREDNARPVDTINSDPSFLETAQQQLALATSVIGNRLYTVDPNRAITPVARDLSTMSKDGRTEVADYFANTSQPTAEGLMRVYTSARENEKEAWNKVKRVYDGALYLGLDPDEYLREAGLTKERIKLMEYGEFRSEVLDLSSIREHAKDAINRAPESEKDRVRQHWENAEDILLDVQETQ
jgi:hypothetical protein